MKNRIYIVGMGPGKEEMMTGEALKALEEADVIVGYPVYLNLLGERFKEKELLSHPHPCSSKMRGASASGCRLTEYWSLHP